MKLRAVAWRRDGRGGRGSARQATSALRREAFSEFGGGRARVSEPQRERSYSADGEVGLERARRGTGQLTSLAQLAGAFVGRRDHGSQQQIGVAAQVLRGRVHDQISAQLERPLDKRRSERAVDHDQRIRLARCGADGREVSDRQQWVRWRFEPQQVRVDRDLEPARGVLMDELAHARSLPGRGGQYPQHRRGLRCFWRTGRLLAEAPRPQAETAPDTQE